MFLSTSPKVNKILLFTTPKTTSKIIDQQNKMFTKSTKRELFNKNEFVSD